MLFRIKTYITFFLYHRFVAIKSVKIAEEKGLTWSENIHGDGINMFNCRSFFVDKCNLVYRCAELKKN